MKRTSLVGGVIVAATLTLIAVGGPAHASSALSGPVYAQSTWIVPVQPGVPDVILALSDMVGGGSGGGGQVGRVGRKFRGQPQRSGQGLDQGGLERRRVAGTAQV